MEEKIITEINDFLANPESSTIAILNKAIQLADINNDNDYSLLFSYHLNGISSAETIKLKDSNPQVLSMFSADRMKSGETNYLIGSIIALERSLQNYKNDVISRTKQLDSLGPYDITGTYLSSSNIQRNAIATVIGTLRTHAA
jgi:hypothetical protein